MSNDLKPVLHGELLPASAFSATDLTVFAEQVAKSKLFTGIDTPAAAFALMLICQSEGLHPAVAMKRYHIINGRPSMRADAMQAEFQARGGIIRWGKSNDDTCTATFLHPIQAPDGVEITWNMKRAQTAGITKNPTWQKYPAAMLRARTISEGVRMVLPGVVAGIYTPEEVEAFEPAGFPRQVEHEPTATNGTNGAAPRERKTWSETLDGAGRLWERLDPKNDRKIATARRLRLINGLVSWALDQELIVEKAILNELGSRDPRLCAAVAEELYDRHGRQVREQLKAHIDDAIARDNAPPPPAREAQQRLPSADPSLPPVQYGDAAEFDECEQPPAEAN